MLCSQCFVAMTEEHSYDYSADVEQFLVTSWRCGHCDGVIEEIITGSSQGLAPKRIRYAVRPWQEPAGVGAA